MGRFSAIQDFDDGPLVVFYETTRACDLKCRHCRADAQLWCHREELTTAQAKLLIQQLTQFRQPPLLVLTGGDPLKRQDVFELIDYAIGVGLRVAMTPSATPLLTRQALRRLKSSGLHRLAMSLDGATPATHDGFRGVAGSLHHTLQIVADAAWLELPVQINTTIGRHNVHELDRIAELLSCMDVVLWSVFFLVPTGRAKATQRLRAHEVEDAFEKLLAQSRRHDYAVKTTEAPHYRRYVLQHGNRAAGSCRAPAITAATNDGKGVMFISHIGEIQPSGFLPITGGRFPLHSVVQVYQESELFRALRDPDQLGGKCGVCEFRHICGGSRARAYAMTGDPLAQEPDCAYVPAGWAEESCHVER